MTKLTDEQCRRLVELLDELANCDQQKDLLALIKPTKSRAYQCFIERMDFFFQDGDRRSREVSATPSAALLAALEKVAK